MLLTPALDSIFYASLIVIPFSRLSGSCLSICEKKAQAPSASSLGLNWLSISCVSTAPGEIEFIPMPRSLNSAADSSDALHEGVKTRVSIAAQPAMITVST
jgi:hypothetical protein